MAAIASGVSLQMAPVLGFSGMDPLQADLVLYTQVVPFCEAKGIYLSSYGNCAGQGALENVAKYQADKAAHKLFDVARVQRAVASIPGFIQSKSTYQIGSYSLKHRVEERTDEYLTNGDCIVAMLILGHIARFGKHSEEMSVNAEFKIKVV